MPTAERFQDRPECLDATLMCSAKPVAEACSNIHITAQEPISTVLRSGLRVPPILGRHGIGTCKREVSMINNIAKPTIEPAVF